MKQANRLFFSKKLRLLNTNDFGNVFQHAKKCKMFEIIVLHCLNNLCYPRLGLIVSKKVSKYAYQRNKIKRLVKESFRLMQYNLIYCDFVLIVQPNILKFTKKIFNIHLHNLWKRYYR